MIFPLAYFYKAYYTVVQNSTNNTKVSWAAGRYQPGIQNCWKKKKKITQGFPGGSVVSQCQWKRHEFNPWSGKIPYTTEQLNQWAPTIQPVFCSPGAASTEACTPQHVPQKKIHCYEEPVHHRQRKGHAYWRTSKAKNK